MRLSEAIARGAELRPQAHDAYFKVTTEGLASCAMGAAYEAVTGYTRLADGTDNYDLISYITGTDIGYVQHAHPVTGEKDDLASIIVDLNDEYTWPRERIAAWLSSLGL
jgi:hypothetical protein